MDFESALRVLEEHGALQLGPTRSGSYVAELPEHTRVIATAATVGGREVSEHDRLGLLGLLLTAASERGLAPVELMAAGFALALQEADASQD